MMSPGSPFDPPQPSMHELRENLREIIREEVDRAVREERKTQAELLRKVPTRRESVLSDDGYATVDGPQDALEMLCELANLLDPHCRGCGKSCEVGENTCSEDCRLEVAVSRRTRG